MKKVFAQLSGARGRTPARNEFEMPNDETNCIELRGRYKCDFTFPSRLHIYIEMHIDGTIPGFFLTLQL